MTLQRVNGYRSKKDLVYKALHDAIVRGDLRPGIRLIIDDLAKQLHVSPSPIREALQHLESDGFVTIEPYVGVRVSEINKDLVYEVFGLLEGIESVSMVAASGSMSSGDLDAIERQLRYMDGLADNPDLHSEANMRFHLMVCECKGLTLAKTLMSTVLDQWNRLRRYYCDEVYAGRIAVAQEEHWGLLNALRKGDPDLAGRLVREHNRNALRAYAMHLGTTDPVLESGRLAESEVSGSSLALKTAEGL